MRPCNLWHKEVERTIGGPLAARSDSEIESHLHLGWCSRRVTD